jgi:hypothetical protein
MGSLPNAVMERSARRVHLLRVRTSEPALSSRIQSWLEEALRLTTLPGEDQGRVYFFRRLRLPPLHALLPALEWIARCSEQLLAISRCAVHVTDAQSSHADAVYSRDANEPFRLLFSRWLAGEAREWFWPQATGVSPELPRAVAVEQLFVRWCSQPAGWAGVAREFLPSLRVEQIAPALTLIRPETAQSWLTVVGRTRSQLPIAIPLPVLHAETSYKLYRAQILLGDRDPRVRWLCVLAILQAAPSLAQDAALPVMAARLLETSPPKEVFVPDAPIVPLAEHSKSILASQPHTAADVSRKLATAIAGRARDQAPSDCGPRDDPGRATAFAGLYFLLTPLRLLGIANAYEAFPELAITYFVERVLLRLARSSGVEEDDPVLLPCSQCLSDAPLPPDPLVFPNPPTSLRRLRSSPALTERLWAAAVRRWCHRHAKMRLAEIVSRPGRIYATRTALDVTMPMSAVDLRIRRCGLDIDPGYQRWFGQVTHFHYHVEV